MKTILSCLMISACMLLPATQAVASTSQVDQLIIKYKSSIQARSTQRQLRERAVANVSQSTGLAVRYKRAMAPITSAHVIKLPYEMSVDEARQHAAQIMADNPGIEYAEPDYRRYARRVPNDPQQSQQWAIQDTATFAGSANLYQAWDLTTGSGAVAAILDTGYRPHADLTPNVVGEYDFVSEDADGDGGGRDADASDPGVPEDDAEGASWHGTHVAGIVGAKGNNSVGVAGTAYDSALLMLRVLGIEGGSQSDQVDAMLWAAGETVLGIPNNPNPANVINLSVGTDGFVECGSLEQEAFTTLRNKGVVSVISAGNENRNTEGSAPANCEGVIAVAGLAMDGARASFSNYGPINDIAAPAVQILSTYNSGANAPVASPGGDTYHKDNGTSQAAPRVTGVVSLMFAANSALRDGTIPKNTVADVIESKLKASVRSFPTSISGSSDPQGCNSNLDTNCVCTTSTCGAGMLDAYQAVLAVSTKPTANAGADQNVASAASVTLNGSASSDDAYNKDGSGNPVLTYNWTQTGGTTVSLSSASAASPTFTAPTVNTSTALTFQLTVTDDTGLTSDADTVVVTVGDGNSGTSASEVQVQEVYIAYYGRPADPGGLNFWSGQLGSNGGDLSAIINQFGNSTEYTDRFSGLDNETLVNNIYQNLFNRSSDSAGLAFYTGRLANNESTLAQIALQILDGAINEDKTIVDNKQEVAAYFTAQVSANNATYNDDSIPDAVAIISSVTADSASVTSAKSQVDSWIAGN